MLWVDTGLYLNVKKYGNTSVYIHRPSQYKAYFNGLFGTKYIINENGIFLGAAKYVVGLL